MTTKYHNLSDEDLEKLKQEKEDYIESLWNLSPMLPWNEYIKRVEKTNITEIYAEVYLRKEPVLRPASEFDLECRMTLEDFKNCCKNHMFINDDGSGYYGTETERSDIPADPSHFCQNWNRTDFKYVYWYNK